jgi:hypothetical protein
MGRQPVSKDPSYSHAYRKYYNGTQDQEPPLDNFGPRSPVERAETGFMVSDAPRYGSGRANREFSAQSRPILSDRDGNKTKSCWDWYGMGHVNANRPDYPAVIRDQTRD